MGQKAVEYLVKKADTLRFAQQMNAIQGGSFNTRILVRKLYCLSKNLNPILTTTGELLPEEMQSLDNLLSVREFSLLLCSHVVRLNAAFGKSSVRFCLSSPRQKIQKESRVYLPPRTALATPRRIGVFH